MIQRNLYIQQLISYMWDGQIKVITGIRRCGKSVLLFELFRDYLLSQGTNADHIITIELDKRKDIKYRNPIALCDMVEEKIQESTQQYYLFIDEIQLSISVPDPDFPGEKVTIYEMLNELRGYKNLDIYVTGSNSKMLSSDIMTEFRGRSSQIHVFPFSFKEFFMAVGGDKRDAFDRYMLYGGMPYLLNLKEDRQKKDYLKQLFDEVYIKDIVEREGISYLTEKDGEINQHKEAYWFGFTRRIDGISVTMTSNSSLGNIEDENSQGYESYPKVEMLVCVVDQDRIVYASFTNPWNIGEALQENVQLLPFEQIMKVFGTIAPLSIQSQEGDKNAQHWTYGNAMQINEVRLGYMPVLAKDGDGDWELRPVWDFFGIHTSGATIRDEAGLALLTIDAIDGTIIDRNYGY